MPVNQNRYLNHSEGVGSQTGYWIPAHDGAGAHDGQEFFQCCSFAKDAEDATWVIGVRGFTTRG